MGLARYLQRKHGQENTESIPRDHTKLGIRPHCQNYPHRLANKHALNAMLSHREPIIT